MYRKGVSAIIINLTGEFLLVNLVSFEDKYFAIPGGGVEEGETLEDAVYREIKEELGIEKTSLRFIGKNETPLHTNFKTPKTSKAGQTYIGSERYFFGFEFIGPVGTPIDKIGDESSLNDEIKLQESEVRAYKWVPFNDLDKYLLFDGQLEDTLGEIRGIFENYQIL